jgi:hypothetical protein
MILKRVNLEMLLKQSLKESIEQVLEIAPNKICFLTNFIEIINYI